MEKCSASIVNVSSMSSIKALPTMSFYGYSKGGVGMLTKVVALEYAEYGICCNEVIPGYTMSELFVGPNAKQEMLTKAIPMKRIAEAREVANATLFFASDEGSYCTADSLCTSGGMYR